MRYAPIWGKRVLGSEDCMGKGPGAGRVWRVGEAVKGMVGAELGGRVEREESRESCVGPCVPRGGLRLLL